MSEGQAQGATASQQTPGRSVIVNGDDFGLSREVNAGIIRAHREGILNSASLMVAEPAHEEAAAAAKELKGLDVGLHLVVCRGRSVLAPTKIAPLVDAAGNFTTNPVLSGMKYFFQHSIRDKLAAEMRAQIERHLELVGVLNHIDGHLNFHVHPVIADLLIDLASEYKVPCIRMPREAAFTTLALARDHAPRKLMESVIFRSLSRRARAQASERGIKFNDWLFGLHQSGHTSEDYVLGVLDRLRPGVTELYFHPAMDIGETPPDANAQLEVEILTSQRVREALRRHSIGLTTFAELADGRTPVSL